MRIPLPDEAATAALGQRLAMAVPDVSEGPFFMALEGPLGAGKTSLARAFLRALGHEGAVRSPTYTLLEPYEFDDRLVVHLDLYRLSDPGELDYLGVEDLFCPGHILLVEWPERGLGHLPAPDLSVRLAYAGSGRQADLRSGAPPGQEVLTRLEAQSSCESL